MSKLVNLLYLFDGRVEKNQSSGVYKKIVSQCKALARDARISCVYLAGYGMNDRFMIKKIERESEREVETFSIYEKGMRKKWKTVYEYLKIWIINNEIKFLYCRKFQTNRKQLDFFDFLRRQNILICLEMPTYPYFKERFKILKTRFKSWDIKGTLKTGFLFLEDAVLTRQLRKSVSLIVTFAGQKEILGVPCVPITNGIGETVGARHKIDHKDQLNLLFVANVAAAHGLDRVLNGLASYQKNSSVPNVHLYIVGEGPERPNLERLCATLHLKDAVTFCGQLFGEDLQNYYDIADVAISSIGSFRLNLIEWSPLKTREYLGVGLPCIGVDTDHEVALHPVLSKFYMKVRNDNSPILVEEIIDFWNSVKTYEPEEIREAALRTFSWEQRMEKVFSYWQEMK